MLTITLRGRVVLEARGPRGRLHRAEAEREEHGGDDEVDDHRDPGEQREAHEAELGGVRVAGRREHRDDGLGRGVGDVVVARHEREERVELVRGEEVAPAKGALRVRVLEPLLQHPLGEAAVVHDVEVVAAEHGRGGLGGPDRLVADAAAVVRREAELVRAGGVRAEGRGWRSNAF